MPWKRIPKRARGTSSSNAPEIRCVHTFASRNARTDILLEPLPEAWLFPALLSFSTGYERDHTTSSSFVTTGSRSHLVPPKFGISGETLCGIGKYVITVPEVPFDLMLNQDCREPEVSFDISPRVRLGSRHARRHTTSSSNFR